MLRDGKEEVKKEKGTAGEGARFISVGIPKKKTLVNQFVFLIADTSRSNTFFASDARLIACFIIQN